MSWIDLLALPVIAGIAWLWVWGPRFKREAYDHSYIILRIRRRRVYISTWVTEGFDDA